MPFALAKGAIASCNGPPSGPCTKGMALTCALPSPSAHPLPGSSPQALPRVQEPALDLHQGTPSPPVSAGPVPAHPRLGAEACDAHQHPPGAAPGQHLLLLTGNAHRRGRPPGGGTPILQKGKRHPSSGGADVRGAERPCGLAPWALAWAGHSEVGGVICGHLFSPKPPPPPKAASAPSPDDMCEACGLPLGTAPAPRRRRTGLDGERNALGGLRGPAGPLRLFGSVLFAEGVCPGSGARGRAWGCYDGEGGGTPH